jgi:hypothetical protein
MIRVDMPLFFQYHQNNSGWCKYSVKKTQSKSLAGNLILIARGEANQTALAKLQQKKRYHFEPYYSVHSWV